MLVTGLKEPSESFQRTCGQQNMRQSGVMRRRLVMASVLPGSLQLRAGIASQGMSMWRPFQRWSAPSGPHIAASLTDSSAFGGGEVSRSQVALFFYGVCAKTALNHFTRWGIGAWTLDGSWIQTRKAASHLACNT